jgi:ketosteroid isomerase-like protein
MSVVHDFAAAFNRRDVDGLLACFTEAASYVDTFYGEHRGRPALRAMFERMFLEGRDYAWTMDTVVETPARAAAEWTFSYVVTEAVPRSQGRKVRFQGMSFFELQGGKIAVYRESFDTGWALLQLGFAPESLAKVLSRKYGA